MTKRRGHRHGHGRKNKRTMRRRRSHSAHLTRSRRHHRHGSRSRARRGGLSWTHAAAKLPKHLWLALERNKAEAKTAEAKAARFKGINKVSHNDAELFKPSTNRPKYSSVMQTLGQLGTVPSPSSRGVHAASSAHNMSP